MASGAQRLRLVRLETPDETFLVHHILSQFQMAYRVSWSSG